MLHAPSAIRLCDWIAMSNLLHEDYEQTPKQGADNVRPGEENLWMLANCIEIASPSSEPISTSSLPQTFSAMPHIPQQVLPFQLKQFNLSVNDMDGPISNNTDVGFGVRKGKCEEPESSSNCANQENISPLPVKPCQSDPVEKRSKLPRRQLSPKLCPMQGCSQKLKLSDPAIREHFALVHNIDFTTDKNRQMRCPCNTVLVDLQTGKPYIGQCHTTLAASRFPTHLRTSAKHLGAAQVQCKGCLKDFAQQHSLRRHWRLCTKCKRCHRDVGLKVAKGIDERAKEAAIERNIAMRDEHERVCSLSEVLTGMDLD